MPFLLTINVPIVVCLALGVAGCEDSRRHQTSERVELTTVPAPLARDAAAVDVVRAVVRDLGTAQAVRERGLGDAAARRQHDNAMAELRSLAAGDAIFETVQKSGSASVPVDITRDAAVKLATESWVSVGAHYIAGVDPASVQESDGRDQNKTTVYVEAERPDERSRLAAIEALPEIREARDSAGRPSDHGSAEYIERIRAKAIAQGFNVPIRARLEFTLLKEDGAWRVKRIGLGGIREPMVRRAETRPAGA